MAKFSIEVELDFLEEDYSIDEEIKEAVVCGVKNELLKKSTDEVAQRLERAIAEKLEEEKQRLRNLKNNTIALSDSEVIAIEEKAYNFAINIVKQEINNGLE